MDQGARRRIRWWRVDRRLAAAGGRWLVVIVAIALVLRVLVVLGTPNYVPTGDAADYDRHAEALVAAGQYPHTLLAAPGSPTAFRPPGYPMALATIYGPTGQRWKLARLVGALLGAISVYLVFALAARVWTRRRGLWAAGLAAVFPPLVFLPAGLVAENLFIPLMLAALLCVVGARHATNPVRLALLAGVLCGLATLTRTNGLVVALAVVVGLWPAAPRRGRRLAAPVVAMVATALVLLPWALRNDDVLGRLLPLGSQAGFTMAATWNAEADEPGSFRGAPRVPADLPAYRGLFRTPGINEAALDVELRDRATRYARDHPGYVLTTGMRNSLRLFELGPGHTRLADVSYREMGVPPGWRIVLRVSVWLMLAAALAGLVAMALRRARPGPAYVWVAPVLTMASLVFLVAAPRHRAPIDPFLALLASGAFVAWSRSEAGGGRPL